MTYTKRILLFPVVLVIAGTVGCGANMEQTVRQRAAHDLACPVTQLTLIRADAMLPGNNDAYTAQGCGKEKTYEGACSFSCSIQEAPSGETLAALQASRTQPDERAAPSSAATPASEGPVSFSLKSECPRTVKLFIGNKPKYGSGTETSISSHEIRSFNEMPGRSIWLLDDSGNGVSALGVSRGMSDMLITSACTGFVPGR